ncbi:hypothetical protein LDO32_08395 [Luteimonas sp. Y-2-2-4F]|nr:hypothetical protein [Luteimonas sp. Y-2-2-4F]MCD9031743.1 hypothetical protein [Luteimonas sp. Y-2-2-4F]
MPAPFRPLPTCLLAAALLAGSGLAQAQGRPEGPRQERVRPPPPRGQDAMTESIRHVRSAARGEVLSAEAMHIDGREINRIKMLDERGRVRVYEDDPQRRRLDARLPPTRDRDD